MCIILLYIHYIAPAASSYYLYVYAYYYYVFMRTRAIGSHHTNQSSVAEEGVPHNAYYIIPREVPKSKSIIKTNQ